MVQMWNSLMWRTATLYQLGLVEKSSAVARVQANPPQSPTTGRTPHGSANRMTAKGALPRTETAAELWPPEAPDFTRTDGDQGAWGHALMQRGSGSPTWPGRVRSTGRWRRADEGAGCTPRTVRRDPGCRRLRRKTAGGVGPPTETGSRHFLDMHLQRRDGPAEVRTFSNHCRDETHVWPCSNVFEIAGDPSDPSVPSLCRSHAVLPDIDRLLWAPRRPAPATLLIQEHEGIAGPLLSASH